MERVKYITLMRLQLKAPKIELKHDWFRTFKKFKSGKYIGFAKNFQYFAEITFWAQQRLEKIVIRCFNNLHKLTPNKKCSLCRMSCIEYGY
jgi:hypothetical protein